MKVIFISHTIFHPLFILLYDNMLITNNLKNGNVSQQSANHNSPGQTLVPKRLATKQIVSLMHMIHMNVNPIHYSIQNRSAHTKRTKRKIDLFSLFFANLVLFLCPQNLLFYDFLSAKPLILRLYVRKNTCFECFIYTLSTTASNAQARYRASFYLAVERTPQSG